MQSDKTDINESKTSNIFPGMFDVKHPVMFYVKLYVKHPREGVTIVTECEKCGNVISYSATTNIFCENCGDVMKGRHAEMHESYKTLFKI